MEFMHRLIMGFSAGIEKVMGLGAQAATNIAGYYAGMELGKELSMDYGRLRIGQERFEVVRDVVIQGMKAAILIIDSTKGISSFEISLIRKLKKSKIPFVLALNKQDLN